MRKGERGEGGRETGVSEGGRDEGGKERARDEEGRVPSHVTFIEHN